MGPLPAERRRNPGVLKLQDVSGFPYTEAASGRLLMKEDTEDYQFPYYLIVILPYYFALRVAQEFLAYLEGLFG